MGLVPSGTVRSFSGPDGKNLQKKFPFAPVTSYEKKVKRCNNVLQADTVTATKLC